MEARTSKISSHHPHIHPQPAQQAEDESNGFPCPCLHGVRKPRRLRARKAKDEDGLGFHDVASQTQGSLTLFVSHGTGLDDLIGILALNPDGVLGVVELHQAFNVTILVAVINLPRQIQRTS